MQGAFATYTVQDLLYGFTSSLAANINTMDLYTGTDSDVNNLVTPVLNDQMGAVSEQELAIYSGALNDTQVSMVRFLNDVCYLNMNEAVFNGAAYDTITQPTIYAATSYKGAALLSDATNGM